ncbi:hypothetical protein FS749_005099 [Ceratobasidium sp. UAMH 11750]|nr:hypothetical protein FS749_005099 [Ceratobasidium sp. UAMH 11750]
MSLAGNLTPEQLEQLAEATFSSNKSLNLGPFILGSVIDALLCGILLMQCGTYIGLSSQDNRLLKVTITYVVAMNLLVHFSFFSADLMLKIVSGGVLALLGLGCGISSFVTLGHM